MRFLENENQRGVTDNGSGGSAVARTKYLELTWAHDEQLPLHLLTGFRVVLFEGLDPNDTSRYLVPPVEVGKLERSVVLPLALSESRTVNAAVQARYTSGSESSWRLLSGGVAADPDTSPILDGTPGSVTPDMLSGQNQLPFEYTFDTWNPDHWMFVSGFTGATALLTTGAHGGRSLRCTGAVWAIWKYNIPYDPNKLYKFTIRWRQVADPTSGGKDAYVGMQMVNATGAYLEDKYSPAATAAVSASWSTRTVYWRGRMDPGLVGQTGAADPSMPAKAHGDTAYFRPSFRVNLLSGNGVAEVDSISIEELGWQAGADNIGPGAVTDEKLLVPPNENLIPNGFSEAGQAAVGRFPEGLNLVQDAVNSRDGIWCRRLDLTGAFQDMAWTRKIACTPGDQFWISVWVKGSVAMASGGNFMVAWYNGAGNWLINSFVPLNSVTTSYQQFQLLVTCPPNGVAFAVYWEHGVAGNAGRTLFMDSAQCRKVVTFDMIKANTFRTMSYVEDASGYATTGAQMDSSTGGYALKVAANSLLIGRYAMTDLLFRTLQALDGTFSTGRTFYRGNNDVSATSRLGAPNVQRLSMWVVDQHTSTGGTGPSWFKWGFRIQPGQNGTPSAWQTDNLDAMRYLRVKLYTYTYPSTTKTLHSIFEVPLTDRLYAYNAGSNPDFNSQNQIRGSFDYSWPGEAYATTPPGSGKFGLVVGVILYNAYGPSLEGRLDSPTVKGEGFAQTLIANSTWDGTPAAPGGGGGSGGGYTCVAPETPVLLPGGEERPAHALRPGDFVWTWHDGTGQPGAHMVTRADVVRGQRRWLLTTTDGRTLVATWNHRVLVESLGWRRLSELTPGSRVEGLMPGTVASCRPLDDGPVVHITVEGAHTYVSAGLLSHNLKTV